MGNHPWVRIPPLPPDTKTPKGVFWYVAEGVCGRAHLGSTDSSGTNLDSRRAGPERAARRVRPKDGPNISHPFRHIPKPRKGFFGMWRKGCVDEPTRVRQIRPERIWTAEGLARSAQRGG